LHLPRNSRPNLAQYISERLEMTPNGFGGKEGQNNKKKIKNEKTKHYIRNNSAGTWLLCVFASGKSGSANRRFMA
jgi:hypothetical protein